MLGVKFRDPGREVPGAGAGISKLAGKEGLPRVRFRDPVVQEVPGAGTGKGGAEISKLARKEGTGKVASRRERKALGAQSNSRFGYAGAWVVARGRGGCRWFAGGN